MPDTANAGLAIVALIAVAGFAAAAGYLLATNDEARQAFENATGTSPPDNTPTYVFRAGTGEDRIRVRYLQGPRLELRYLALVNNGTRLDWCSNATGPCTEPGPASTVKVGDTLWATCPPHPTKQTRLVVDPPSHPPTIADRRQVRC